MVNKQGLGASIFRMDPSDNVLVALSNLSKSTITFEGKEIELLDFIPQKHKFLSQDLNKGDKVIMYGVPVATANYNLKKGALITTKNISHYAEKPVIRESAYQWNEPNNSRFKNKTFLGYHRTDGRVGTANYWLLVPLVFCENRNLKVLEQTLIKGLGYEKPNEYDNYLASLLNQENVQKEKINPRKFANIEGIKFLYHQSGCGRTPSDIDALLKLLAGYVHHPNVAGATVLSLGCQHAQINMFKEVQNKYYPDSKKPVFFLEQQDLKTTDRLLKEAIRLTLEGMEEANQISRQPAGLDKLVIGLECGGSDGFSGLSANPALGHASDIIVSFGGSSILGEFPELNGVEQNIIDRCNTLELAKRFVDLQYSYAQAAEAAGSGFKNNPSPGNIKDGLITDAIKSAGAARKGGTAPISGILDYGEPLVNPGLNLLRTPGNDVESTTGLAGSGANVIVFTSGLGTPTGNAVCPVIKVSTNSELADSMPDIIDLDAGGIIKGEKTIESVGEEIVDLIIEVASGKSTKAMELGQDDFIPWKRAVSL